MASLFSRKHRSAWASAATLLLAVGCGSGANSDLFQDQPGPVTHVRPPDATWLGGAQYRPTTTTSPPGDVGDPSSVVGRWFVNKDNVRFDLVITFDEGRLGGTLAPEKGDGPIEPLERVAWDLETGHLRFRVQQDGQSLWFAIDVAEGVMTGRYATAMNPRVGPASWSAYSGHVVGWRNESFNTDIVPRVFDLTIDDGRIVRLRIDRNPTNPAEFIGEFKTVATATKGSEDELPSLGVQVRRWDGKQLLFDAPIGTTRQRFSGSVNGRRLEGTMFDGVAPAVRFTGTRSNILSYGLRSRTVEARRDWQERSRRVLYRLMMAGNPAPLTTDTTLQERPVLKASTVAPDRDDDATRWDQHYRLTDVILEHTLPNPYGPEPMHRRMHGILAVPETPPPADGYPLVVSLNGHLGSAERQFAPADFWFADAYARRGYMVLAIDVSHRPPEQSGGLYWDPPDGDHPDTGNHAHPSIAATGLDSDWAEDGERAWDAMRGVDFLLSQPKINASRIIVTGLSLGAEVSEIVGALDPRVTAIVPSGASPDLFLMAHHANHLCWAWAHGDATEFVEMSDFLAMVAPRTAIVETGKWDWTYSSSATPYAIEKENAWRARIAYGEESAKLVHYLHSGGHQYRVGDVSGYNAAPDYIQVPQIIAPPAIRKRTGDWELDGETVSLEQTLFDYLAR